MTRTPASSRPAQGLLLPLPPGRSMRQPKPMCVGPVARGPRPRPRLPSGALRRLGRILLRLGVLGAAVLPGTGLAQTPIRKDGFLISHLTVRPADVATGTRTERAGDFV